jgi:hypothetical protein
MGGWAAFTVDLLLPRRCAACDSWLDLGHPARSACRPGTMEMRRRSAFAAAFPSRPPPPARLARRGRRPSTSRAHSGLSGRPAAQSARPCRARRQVPRPSRGGVSLGAALGSLVPLPAGTLVVPVPLHPTRLRERGYDQAALLAHACARAAGLPLAVRGLVRRRDTPAQARLDASARRKNLAGAFVAPAPLARPTVALVDDVLTTGATAEACARALRAADVERIVVLTVGRTP